MTPLEGHHRLPARLWHWVLRAGVAAGHFPVGVAPEAFVAPNETAPHPYLITLANKPRVLIDRVPRGSDGWNDATLQ